jgi:uncharacterized membrane protein
VNDLPTWSSRKTTDLWILAACEAALFTLPLWIHKLPVAVPANWLTSLSQQLFQIRLIYGVYPRIASTWVGPLGDALSQNQLLFMALLDGILGMMAGWVVFQIADRWLNRLVWLVSFWMIWVTLLYLFAKASSLG